MTLKQASLILCLLCFFLFYSCTSYNVQYDIPPEMSSQEKKSEFINHYSQFVRNKKIFIDPGHGGEDRKNIGYLGLAVEADVNLRVALELSKLLTEAGAIVVLSRSEDVTVPLKSRSELANKSGADIFISIHHNAPPQEGDNYTNYTSTYYHSSKDNFNYEPCEHDIAKYIQRDLAYVMRNSGGPGSFDGTYSDYLIYPGEGFSVLRLTEIPAVLVECGFHTHHLQEPKLADKFYNRIEAWGIFKGLCRYFKAGVPDIHFIRKVQEDSIHIVQFAIVDSAGIDDKSVKVYVDSVESDFSFDKYNNVLSLNLSDDIKIATIRIIASNKNGNHSFPYKKEILLNE